MKKILFVCPNYFDLYKIFQGGIEKYSGCEVKTIIYRPYKYKHIGERIKNAVSKAIFKKNLKPFWAYAEALKAVSKSDRFDYTLVICPEILSPKQLTFLKSISDKFIAYYWDGFDHFPAYEDTVQYFDECYTFEPADAEKYKLNFITNFYFAEDKSNSEAKTDLFFLGSYDSRVPAIARIVKLLEKQNQKVVVYLHTKKKDIDTSKLTDSIKIINKFIPFEQTTQYMKETRIVLDIHKDIQRGLSFRVFEAMGLQKKLITTNPDIAKYDFYNPDNIFIWTDDTERIPDTFLNTPYQPIPETIYQKYHQRNWVKRIFNLN